jgi:hypothetical protein
MNLFTKIRLLAILAIFTLAFTISASAQCDRSDDNIQPFLNSNPNFQLEEIQVRAHVTVISKTDGTGNWPHATQQEIDDTKTEIQAWFSHANSLFANILAPLYFDDNGNQVTGIPNNITNAKIKWVLNSNDIVFLDDNSAYSKAYGDSQADPIIYPVTNKDGFFNNYASKKETHINIFVVESDIPPGTGVASGPHNSTSNSDSRIALYNTHSKFLSTPLTTYLFRRSWGGTLNHELGHTLGLGHLWDGRHHAQFPELPWPEWDCHAEGVDCWVTPSATNTGISNNFMGYSKDAYYIAPNQVRYMHNGLMSRQCRKYIANLSSLNPDNYTYKIKSGPPTVWSTNVHLNNDLDIESGAELVLQACLFMDENAVINVKQGGTLTFDGGSISHSFYSIGGNDLTFNSANWQGIKVWGDKIKNQRTEPSAFGKVTSTANGGLITHAITAISTSKLDYGGTIDWSKTGGGIIQLENVKFLNNVRDVEFLSYRNKTNTNYMLHDLSYFKYCEFITGDAAQYFANDDEFNNIPKYEPNVTLWDVYGVKFYVCEFKNTRLRSQYDLKNVAASSNPDALYRIGIASINSYVKVNGLTAFDLEGNVIGQHGNFFYGMEQAISQYGTNGFADGYQISGGNVFENNGKAIVFLNTRNDLVSGNEFSWIEDSQNDVYESVFYDDDDRYLPWALKVEKTKGLIFQSNTNISNLDLSDGDNVNLFPAGVYLRNHDANSGGLVNTSTFTNCWPSIAFDKNLGVRLTCNEFINNGFPSEANSDIRFNDNLSSEILAQGLDDANIGWLPRNKFQENCDNERDHIFCRDRTNIPRDGFTYYVHPLEPLATLPKISCSVQDTRLKITTATSVSLSTCVNRINVSTSSGDHLSKINTYQGYISQSEQTLESGDDPLLKTNLTNPGIANPTLLNDLDAVRPYLSDEVLTLMLNRQPSFDNMYLKAVLIEHSPLSDAIMTLVENHSFTSTELQEIINAQSTTDGAIHQLNRFLMAAKWEKQRQISDFEMAIRDTTMYDSLNIDTLINFYQKVGSDCIAQHINACIEADYLEDASNLLNTLDLNDPEQNDLFVFESLHYALVSSNRNWFELTSTELQTLQNLATNETNAAGYSLGILILIGEEPYKHDWPSIDQSNSSLASANFDEKVTESSLIELFPNPGSANVVLKIQNHLLDQDELVCQIVSVDGKLVWTQKVVAEQTQLNLEDLPKGMYKFIIKTETEVLQETWIKQ